MKPRTVLKVLLLAGLAAGGRVRAGAETGRWRRIRLRRKLPRAGTDSAARARHSGCGRVPALWSATGVLAEELGHGVLAAPPFASGRTSFS